MTHTPPHRGRIAAAIVMTFTLFGAMAPVPARAQTAAASYCAAYANQMIADNFRGQQAKCPDYRAANMKWDSHLQFCEQEPRSAVETVRETSGTKLDACLKTTQAAAAPPAAAQAPVVAAAATSGAAQGKTFRVVPQGAEEDVPVLCVDVAGALAPGTPIQIAKCLGKSPQLFGIDARNARIVLAAAPHLCVDGVPNQPLQVIQCQSAETQWRYEERTKTIRSSNGMCWDVSGGRRPENIRSRRPLIAWPCHSGPNQQFLYSD